MEKPQSCNLLRVGDYTLFELITESAFGTVYKAVNNSGEIFAVKKISINNLPENRLSYYTNEIEILKSFNNHPGIISIVAYMKSTNHLYIVTEFCKGLDLKMYLDRSNNVPFKIVRKFAKTILETMSFLNKYNIVHRDLKPSNLLMTDEDIEISDVKIADFGFAKKIDENMTTTQIGTPLYMAPETFGFLGHTYKADIWSLGVTFYEMLYGFPPFQCQFKEQLMKVQYDNIEFESNLNVPLAAQEMIKAMLKTDPSLRPTYEELLQMEFITGVPEVFNMQAMDSSEIVFSEKFDRKGYLNLNKNLHDKAGPGNLNENSDEIVQYKEKLPKNLEIDKKLNQKYKNIDVNFQREYEMCLNTYNELDEYLAMGASLQDINNEMLLAIIYYYISTIANQLDAKLLELKTIFPGNYLICDLHNSLQEKALCKPMPDASDVLLCVKEGLKNAVQFFFNDLQQYPIAFKLLKIGLELYPDEHYYPEIYQNKRIYFEE